MNKLLDKIMNMEFLAKWLLAWGIGVNVLIVAWIFSKLVAIIASL
jgi:hypothetical protein